MAGWTNKGKMSLLEGYFLGLGIPATFYVMLVTDATAPDADTNTFGLLHGITPGNGYTDGGYGLSKNTTDFDTTSENDTSDLGSIEIKDVVWTASGGNIPASGDGARYALLTDANAVTASREVYCYWDLSSARTVSDTQTLTLADLELQGTES